MQPLQQMDRLSIEDKGYSEEVSRKLNTKEDEIAQIVHQILKELSTLEEFHRQYPLKKIQPKKDSLDLNKVSELESAILTRVGQLIDKVKPQNFLTGNGKELCLFLGSTSVRELAKSLETEESEEPSKLNSNKQSRIEELRGEILQIEKDLSMLNRMVNMNIGGGIQKWINFKEQKENQLLKLKEEQDLLLKK